VTDVGFRAVAAASSLLLALLLVECAYRLVRRYGRGSPLLSAVTQRAYRPTQVLLTLLSLYLALHAVTSGDGWRGPVLHALLLGLIATGAWLAAVLLLILEDMALSRFRTDVSDNRQARRIHTQITLIRRVTIVAVTVIAIGAMLVTFPVARAAGASLLASAGIAGVVAALAAQSLLGNMFAGLQIAFSDAVRLDDVVVVEGQWGRIEAITLSYVVVHLWDDRRLILPSSYFQSKPFENWTRTGSDLLGTVELEVDWSVPVEQMRQELRQIVESTDLWDGRVCVLQVTDATAALVRVRALVSAHDAGRLWDLRCLVRERLVTWLRDEHPYALPRVRAAVEEQRLMAGAPYSSPRRYETLTPGGSGDDRVFSGSVDGRDRGSVFTGPHESSRTATGDADRGVSDRSGAADTADREGLRSTDSGDPEAEGREADRVSR